MSSKSVSLPRAEVADGSVRIDFPQTSLIVEFDHPIRDVLIVEDAILVLVEPPKGVIFNENVFGLSHEGERLWTIGRIQHVYEDSPYTGLSRHADGSVWVSNWDGASCRVSTKSGAILEVFVGR